MSWLSFRSNKTLIDAGKSPLENWDKDMTRRVDTFLQALMTSCWHLTIKLKMLARLHSCLKCIRPSSSKQILQIHHLITKNHLRVSRAQSREDGSSEDLLMLIMSPMMSKFLTSLLQLKTTISRLNRLTNRQPRITQEVKGAFICTNDQIVLIISCRAGSYSRLPMSRQLLISDT